MKKQKVISVSLIISILTTLFIPIVSKADTITDDVNYYLACNSTDVTEGSKLEVTMNMELKSGTNVDTLSATIKYDDSVLSFDDNNEFTINNQTKWSVPSYVDENGEIKLETTRSGKSVGQSGIMFTFYFNVLKTVSSTDISIIELGLHFKVSQIFVIISESTFKRNSESNVRRSSMLSNSKIAFGENSFL